MGSLKVSWPSFVPVLGVTEARIDPRGDPRIAMSCALVGLRRPGVVITTPGVVAAAARDPEVEQEDIKLALRLLAEHLHSTAALWHQWRQHEEPDEAAEA